MTTRESSYTSAAQLGFVGGLTGGLLALAVLEVLHLFAAESPEALAPHYIVAYAVAGVVVGPVVALLRRRRRGALGMADIVAMAVITMAVLYAPLVYDRVYYSVGYRAGSFLLGAAGASVGVLVYLAWIWVLRRVARPDAAIVPIAIGAFTIAVVVVLDRFVFGSVFRPTAMAANGVVVVAGIAAAMLTRARRSLQVAGVLVAVALIVASGVSRASRGAQVAAPAPEEQKRPDLVLLIIDTLRADVFETVVRDTAEGQAFRTALDGGLWFTQAMAVAPWTLPSVGSIMTGHYPPEHGMDRIASSPSDMLWTAPLSDSVPTLGEKLRTIGYQTEAIGTNHFLNPHLTHINRGFGRYDILQDDVWQFPIFRVTEWLHILSVDSPYKDAPAVRRRLAQRLDEIGPPRQPLFLWIHLMDPHGPLHERRLGSADTPGGELPEMNRFYRDGTRQALGEAAKMIELLKAHGRWSNTLFVVVADHGEMFPSDGLSPHVNYPDGKPFTYGHGQGLYDVLLHIPMVVRAPGPQAERRVDVLVNQIDLHATLCDFFGVERADADGISFAPWLSGSDPVPALRAHTVAGSPAHGPYQRAVRSATEKYIEYPGGEYPPELYDLQADPREQANLAGDQPSRVAQASALVEKDWPGAIAQGPAETIDAATQDRLRALGYAH